MLAVIDLATDLNGSFPGDTAIYDRTDLGASGSGNIDSFVRVQNTGVEEGFNSSFRPTQLNEDSTLTFNHDLQLAAVPIVVINGVPYREFLLDVNEPGGTERFISLNKLELYLSNAGSITAYPFNDATGPTATKIYDMDAGTAGTDTDAPSPNGNWVLIDNNLGPGSGSSNIFVYIPNSLFDSNLGAFVTLYSQFGVTVPASSGGEEWAIREATAIFSISGRKFNDLDADHTDDGGTDPGLAGWTIFVDTNNNSLVDAGEPSTVTAADGTYTLSSLIAGTYEVCEVQQPGWTQTFPQTLDGCHTVTVGPNATNINFGNNSTVATTGQKFNDLDGDGVKDSGEPGLINWEIRAYADANSNGLLDQTEFNAGAAATALTNASGDYQLLLNAGAYVVVEVQQSGWTQTSPLGASVLAVGLNTGAIALGSSGYALTLVIGQNVSGRDFGNFDNVDLSGQKFHDLDGDGIQDAGEPGLAGWTIQLDSGANGTVDATTITDASGNYSFTNLGPGTYRLREVQQAGWTQTTANPADVLVSSGTNVSGITFGNFQNINISGQKFNDLDGDGIKEAGELGLINWTIQLDVGANGSVDATTLTDASGNYSFANLGPGTYRIREVQQAGWIQTTTNPADVVAAGGTNVSGVDFGNFQQLAISGQKFHDLDGDGIKDAGELGLPGWTIQLDAGANGSVEATTTTDAAGNYSFANLGPGIYRIREVQQAGWTQTTVNPADITAISGTNASGIDFGNFQNISVSGQKFNDLDGDGIKDAGELGLFNWTIQLDIGANGSVDATTTTDAAGNFTFTNLGPGVYRIREVQQATWTQTTANPADIVAIGGTSVSGIDFGNTQALSISGQKFNDLDGDGVKDLGEPGLLGWTIQLDAGANGSVDATTTTDANGNYTFANVQPGIYRIREVQQALWTQTTVNPADITAISGQNVSGIDFGNFQNISISGQKFNDLDGDGIKDLGEPGLFNWTIQLDIGANGTVDATTLTDASGNYSFSNLPPGVYRVREVQQAGWVQTTANPADVTAVSGQNVSGADFGNFQLIAISGQKFHDLDGDGVKDALEPGLPGWTIQLDLGANGSVDATTATDAAGNYSFANLGPGIYRIREVQQAGFTQTTVNPADITAISGQSVSGIDFGNFQNINISGQKFNDLDGDGVKDLGEPGLFNWTIQLDLGANGSIDATTTTDANGNYNFANLGPGIYRIREVQQATWTQTTANPADIVAIGGTSVSGIDFGNTQALSISGQKFNDLDGDGVKDLGEPGLFNWTIQLDAGADGTIEATTTTDASGNYTFANIQPGIYRIREVQQVDWVQTTANPADVIAVSGQNVSGIDFGNFDLINISGQKFNDLDGDGIKDLGEPGLFNWTIQLDAGANGTVDATTTTDASGNYSFANLGPGVYRIRELQQAGFTQTSVNPADITAVSGTNVSEIDFGNFQNISISGQKFNDLDGDGIQDLGEPGLFNWTIQLDIGANGSVDATTTTDPSGNYSFANLGPGIYRIREVQQATWTQTTANPSDVTAISGTNVSGIDFGNTQALSISGQKFNDLDGDGVKDLGEPGLFNWTIQLDAGADGTIEATTTTDASGNYTFANINPGIYRIREVQQVDWVQTTANPADVIAVSGQNVSGIDFGNFDLINISGQKFNDLDGDGVKEGGEFGLPGITITLDIGADGTVDDTTVTDGSGNYSFSNLPPGVYRVREVLPAGTIQTTPNPADITAQSGVDVSDVDFGNFTLITISGQKFADGNADGSKQLIEPGLPGWTIQLDIGANGTIDATTVTDGDGNYSFTNLGPGIYRVREVQQSGWTQSTTNPADIVAVSGTNATDIDFGNFRPQTNVVVVIAPDKSPTVPALVRILDLAGGQIHAFAAYEANFVGGTRVTTADLTGDNIDEIITAPGRGRAPEIRVFTQEGVELTEFRTMAYLPTFKGGVQVAVGDVNGDGRNDFITAPSSGKAEIRVFLGQNNADPIANAPFKKFLAFPKKFVGGAFVRVADMGTRLANGTFNNNFDGEAEIIVGSGPGMKAAIKVFNVDAAPVAVRTINPFTVGTSVYKNGVNFDVKRLNDDMIPDLLIGTENGGNSRVEAFLWNGSGQLVKVGTFMAYADSPSKIAPVRVAAVDIDGDGVADRLAHVQGPGGTTSQLRLFTPTNINTLAVNLTTTLSNIVGPFFIAGIRNSASSQEPINPEAEGLEMPTLAQASTSAISIPLDVNGDGAVTASDALLVVNRLNQQDATTSSETGDIARYDVNGDGRLTALDALMIVNELNQSAAAAALAPATSGGKAAEDQYRSDVDELFADVTGGLLS